MKNKYNNIYSTYNNYDTDYEDYSQYVDINDYLSQYNYTWSEYKTENEDERLAREKAEKRNNKIDQILG